ncbi:MAG: DUF6326 family protein [Propionibacteriaceae bacterium]|nr:DUF6326 family protein [Propionibacteriaceae bacterium]
MTTTTAPTETPTSLETPIDVRIVLGVLWTTMVLVFAYVDLFGFYRADVLEAALEGRMASTPFVVNQIFLVATLGYILVPTLMVTLSLVLHRRLNRVLTIVVALVVALVIIGSINGETWVYYWVGSLVEVLLLAAIVRTAWGWRV